ncbi:MAG: hypothetical protein J7K40_12990 [candidate division Zixibacteria bacterium]|nr:hypothetical protein [candidate division Zixibacteria bacterium]
MKLKTIFFTISAVLLPANIALAGEFYKLYPYWLEYGYHILIQIMLIVGLFVSFSVFRTLKGGNLGRAWLFIFLAIIVMTARTTLGLLTVFNIAYFQALMFAGLDVLFYFLLIMGLILYKIGLE